MNPVIHSIANTFGFRNEMYAVIIDAGSTGSRVLAYTFYKSEGELILQDELFHEIKPGLSSYVDNPEQGAKSIMKLVEFGYDVVPSRRRSYSPLIVRATAGLRMLNEDSANKLLDVVRKAIQTSGFMVKEDSVEIMDGEPEGIFSWFTANFLQDRLKKESAAALDLGGGSTQVTYEPREDPPFPLTVIPGPTKNTTLYTHSYSGLGLMALRYGVLLEENGGNVTQHMESKCINPLVKNSIWRYNNNEYLISGSEKDIKYKNYPETNRSPSFRDPVVDLERCKQIINKVVKKHLANVPVPTHLVKQDINAFSYFTDRAIDAGIITDMVSGGKAKVSSFIMASKEECGEANVDRPWLCLDLTYMSILLQQAYKLPQNKELMLLKKIKGHEVSWALGLAYHTLSQNL